MASLLAARRSGRRHDAADTHGRGPKRANGARETELLGLLHKAGTALTPGEVAERLGGELTYGSVVTILTRMHTKGLLTRIPRGRAYACALRHRRRRDAQNRADELPRRSKRRRLGERFTKVVRSPVRTPQPRKRRQVLEVAGLPSR
ncbi:BlaI/MecI/CopY family transcriptional regulator [Streptomyces sp. 900105755]